MDQKKANLGGRGTESRSSPSRVNVPVLSKQQRLTFPAMLTRVGAMQKTLFWRRRCTAYATPTIMQAGSAGGMAIVMRSKQNASVA